MRTLQVFYPNRETGALEMKFYSSQPQAIYNEQVLLERIAKILYTKLGSNIFTPEVGSAIAEKMYIIGFADEAQTNTMLHQAIKDVEQLILQEQITNGVEGRTDNQILISLEVLQIYKSESSDTVYVEVLVHTKGNQAFIITV